MLRRRTDHDECQGERGRLVVMARVREGKMKLMEASKVLV
jgi:hypothetical protein